MITVIDSAALQKELHKKDNKNLMEVFKMKKFVCAVCGYVHRRGQCS